MPWFWDLVEMSGQSPLFIPNLLTQSFNQTSHRNLLNLNQHARLIELQLSRTKASLRQWHHKLSLLKEAHPDQSMRQGGNFYKVAPQ